jgi:hypothetical protein
MKFEGKPMYKNPQILDNRGFRRPNNNVPQVFPREQRNRDRDDQRIQTPSKITWLLMRKERR